MIDVRFVKQIYDNLPTQLQFLERIAVALENGALSGGIDSTIPSKFYLVDDDGARMLDDSGRVIILGNDPWLSDGADTTNTTGNYHFIPVLQTAGTHALLPATAGVYYRVTFVFLSATAGDTSWKLQDGATFQTGYTAGDIGFGAVIPLAENLFSTTPGNALNLVVTGGGTIQGHIVAYSYGG